MLIYCYDRTFVSVLSETMRRDRKPLLGELWMVSWRKVQGGRGWELSRWYPVSWVLRSKGQVKDGSPLCVFGVLWPLLQCSLRLKFLEFPGGPVVKNPPPRAGDTGSISGIGRFPHAEGQFSPGTKTAPVPYRPCSATRGATPMRSLCMATRE